MTTRFAAAAFLVFPVALFVCALPAHAGQAPVEVRAPLSADAMETFLLTADIASVRNTKVGVTDSQRATLSDGVLTHDAHIQAVDISMALFQAGKASEVNFKDSYRYNIAAYRLARLLNLDNVPMSVERKVRGKLAAVTWWIDDVRMDEKERVKQQTAGPDPERTSKQMHTMRVFDELIQNKDRNQGNVLWTADWRMWLIDHTRAFRTGRDLLKPEGLTRCDSALLEALRDLREDAVEEAMGQVLLRDEIRALLARRDLIVKHFDELIATRGAAAVLFTMEPRAAAAPGQLAAIQ